MSDEQFFCAYCGYNSDNKERCTHCGQEIDDLYEQSPPFITPLSGRITLRLHDGTDIEQTWKELAEVWRKEEETRPHRPSQLEQFNMNLNTVELYGLSYMVSTLREALGERGSVEFQELPHDQMPYRQPKYQLPRPPTVPRNKR